MNSTKPALLVCTVGGSPAPIICGLKSHNPKHVLFVCSQGSAVSVKEQILPSLEKMPAWRLLILSDEQNLLACVTDIRSGLANALEAWAMPNDVAMLGDFTGGTKVMSAALVLALMENNVQFTYIGGGVRSKNGLGIVQDGEERLLSLVNPWEALSFVHVQQLTDAFNSYHFKEAEHLAHVIAAHGIHTDFFSAFASLARAYALWDGFQYKESIELFEASLPAVERCASTSLKSLLDEMYGNAARLKATAFELTDFLHKQKPCPEYFRDLLANALRRKEQGRYDDAVARLYSLLEKTAKVALLCDCAMDTSALLPEQLPPQFRENCTHLTEQNGTIFIPLYKAYQLLACLNHPLGLSFMKQEEKLNALLHARNFSLLAHGFEPISENVCTQLQTIVFDFLTMREEDLVRFPKLTASALK